MDLRIAGRWAVLCAASEGLGFACAAALVAEGVNVVINARRPEQLKMAAQQLQNINAAVSIKWVSGDITQSDIQDVVLNTPPVVDILVTNAGGPPTGIYSDWTREIWYQAINTNMLTPISLIQAVIDKMVNRCFGRIINITSGAVKAPQRELGLSNGARGGLTTFISGLAKSHALVSHNVTINNLLPGAFDTHRLRQTFVQKASRCADSPESIAIQRSQKIPAGRFGAPEEFGAYCAFLCSTYASYITGQNILIDGGAYPGVF
ncbi:short-chain dehydrogenase/reductase SDR [Xenorhabdus nematophila ATCC 19061]|uniref:Short-chain dehydrogenase/reductase SDR n=1 Tax=Xenorhabdus nematophila (strain ATCC 19061 / DSM 3370 / CCUG 14189 / LMG 1036 / NCIMB 9965 / AN6) TaxID=406817 RepID=D3VA52_XENNA|nr:SDR family oxidoreductase [Xenorhabdus nematophila]CBJ91616.1 short-chain dehydrogenase/reductase SDR [Xenorhabdus nematophila ATCC 19061]CEK24443.1 short-chain dehydrogenase/reductase SDR [Xenorhabdus nematophila AN6/1]